VNQNRISPDAWKFATAVVQMLTEAFRAIPFLVLLTSGWW